MATKSKPKPTLTDAERHKAFKAMAKEVEASSDPKDFDKAFKTVTAKPKADRKQS
jgi:hypothetical protein